MLIKDEDWFDNCPLLNRGIDMGECYDVQMVRCRFINERVLDFQLDREQADKICECCEYNQLIDTTLSKEVQKAAPQMAMA